MLISELGQSSLVAQNLIYQTALKASIAIIEKT